MKNAEGLKAALVKHPKDTQKGVDLKKAFREIALIFIKYFSVNWIFESKIKEKLIYLKLRFKMIKMINYPELFFE